MDTIFKNSKNSKNCDPQKLTLNPSDKIILKRSYKYVVLSNHRIYYTWENIKKLCRRKILPQISPTFKVKFELSDGS